MRYRNFQPIHPQTAGRMRTGMKSTLRQQFAQETGITYFDIYKSPVEAAYYILWLEKKLNISDGGSACCGAELIAHKKFGYIECSDCGKTYRSHA